MKLLNIVAVLILTSITTAYPSIRIENNSGQPIFATLQGMGCVRICGRIGSPAYTTRCCGSTEINPDKAVTFYRLNMRTAPGAYVEKIYVYNQNKTQELARYDCKGSCGPDANFIFNEDHSITKGESSSLSRSELFPEEQR